MILLHRLTAFAVALLTAIGYAVLVYAPVGNIGWLVVIGVLLTLLLGRLLKWEVRRFSFWVFFGTPIFFILSSVFFFLFLENELLKILLGLFVTFGTWLYAENIFAFYHLPSAYQPYALEYLSLVLYVATAFFFTSGSYGAQLFLLLPVWVPAAAIFLAVLFATIGVFWVSKVTHEQSIIYAISGAVLMTELYMMLAMLPTSFVVNASAFSVFLYLYLGLSRAHVLDKLTKTVLKRYIAVGVILLLAIFATAKWV